MYDVGIYSQVRVRAIKRYRPSIHTVPVPVERGYEDAHTVVYVRTQNRS
jgi:hypothetical protein